jgi:hypothetical protein
LIRNPAGLKETAKIGFSPVIVCEILGCISWSSGNQDLMGKLSYMIYNSSSLQNFGQFRPGALTNELSGDFAIETCIFSLSIDRKWGIHFQCPNFKRNTNAGT